MEDDILNLKENSPKLDSHDGCQQKFDHNFIEGFNVEDVGK